MSENVKNFLIKLGEDPTAANEFKSNPHESMSNAGLDQHEKDAILSKDPAKIRSLVQSGKDGDVIVIVVVVILV